MRLPTYATWWIRAYILKFLLDNVRLVRVGTTNARRRLLHNLRDEKRAAGGAGVRGGAQAAGRALRRLRGGRARRRQALRAHDVPLDAPVGDEGRAHPRPTCFPRAPPTSRRRWRAASCRSAPRPRSARFRAGLGERERAILDERILADDPLTLQALGDRFGTTREAVRQAEARLMARLKSFIEEELGDLASIRIGPD